MAIFSLYTRKYFANSTATVIINRKSHIVDSLWISWLEAFIYTHCCRALTLALAIGFRRQMPEWRTCITGGDTFRISAESIFTSSKTIVFGLLPFGEKPLS